MYLFVELQVLVFIFVTVIYIASKKPLVSVVLFVVIGFFFVNGFLPSLLCLGKG